MDTSVLIDQLRMDTGCHLNDLASVMADRDKWWERVKDIHVDEDGRRRRTDIFLSFPKALAQNEMQNPYPGFELSSMILFSTMLIVMLNMPSKKPPKQKKNLSTMGRSIF